MTSRADRLNAITARLGEGATYVQDFPAPGVVRFRVSHPITGDVIGATGADVDQALDALDAKVPAPPAAQ